MTLRLGVQIPLGLPMPPVAKLRALIDASAAARAELHFIHLVRHLETPPLQSPEQIAQYNALRGYGEADPCSTFPEGHSPCHVAQAQWV